MHCFLSWSGPSVYTKVLYIVAWTYHGNSTSLKNLSFRKRCPKYLEDHTVCLCSISISAEDKAQFTWIKNEAWSALFPLRLSYGRPGTCNYQECCLDLYNQCVPCSSPGSYLHTFSTFLTCLAFSQQDLLSFIFLVRVDMDPGSLSQEHWAWSRNITLMGRPLVQRTRRKPMERTLLKYLKA